MRGHRQLPAHAAGEVTADRETETNAALAARQAWVYLDKWLEDVVQLLRRNADTGIPHLDVDRAFIRLTVNRDAPPTVREFEGIAHEIEQNLTKPFGIGVDRKAGATGFESKGDVL